MAERTVSTKLILQGEKEYRAAIVDINREMKVLDSQIKLVDSSFQGQRNTTAALEARHKALSDVIAKQTEKLGLEKAKLAEVQKLQGEYAQQAADARAKLDTLVKSTDDAAKETDEYKEAVKALQAEIARNEGAEDKCAVAVQNHTTKANQAQIKINDLNRELSNNDRYLDEAKASTDGCAKSIDEFGKEVKNAGDEAADFGEKGKAGFEELAAALAAAGISATVKEIAQALMDCVDASVSFESAMAGVAKTTDMTSAELSDMGEQFKAMSLVIPISANELAQIAEAAGQLGIAKDNITAFVEIMAKLGTATDMTSTEAATMLAQFSAVTGMDPSRYSNLGSAIVALGNNFSTTEKKITEMAQTTAGAGANAGMSEPQILALSTAVTSLGIEASTGGTNMSKLIGDMQMAVETGEGLDKWAAAAGMSAAEFSMLWGDDAVAALRAFIVGLGDSDESMLATLSTLGITEARTTRMITSLANAEKQNGTLTKAINLSNNAWQANNALNKEAATRFETTESKATLYKNSVEALKIAIGDQLTPALGDLAETGTDVTEWATEFVEQNEWLAPAITGVVVALGALTTGVVAVTVVVPALKAAWAALSGTFVASPVFMVITALAGLVAGIATYVAATKQSISELTEAADALPEKFKTADENYSDELGDIEGTTAKAEALTARLQELETKQNETGGLDASEWREWNMILEVLVETIPELSSVINLETHEITGGTDALIKNTEEVERNNTALAKQKLIRDKYDAYLDVIGEAANNRVKLTIATKDAEVAENKYKESVGRLTAATGITEEQLHSTGDASALLTLLLAGTSDEYGSLVDEVIRLSGENDAAQKSVDDLTAAVAHDKEVVAESKKAYDDYNQALDEMLDSSGDAEDGVRTLTEAERAQVTSLEELQSELANAAKEYDAAYQSSLSGISSVVSGLGMIEKVEPFKIFGKTGEDEKKSVEEILNSQDEFLKGYQANIDKIKAKALEAGVELDAGLLEVLTSGTEEGAALAAGLADATTGVDGGSMLSGLNEKWASISEGKENLATTMADMNTDFNSKSAELVAQMTQMVNDLDKSDAAATAARDTMSAFNSELTAGSATTAAIVAYINQLIASIGSGETASPTSSSGSSPTGHASGLSYVPYDEYPAYLHKGERVLTALQAKAMDAENAMAYSYPVTDATVLPGGGSAQQSEAIDYERLGASVARALSGVAVNIDGEKAGELLTEPISRNIADDARASRYD